MRSGDRASPACSNCRNARPRRKCISETFKIRQSSYSEKARQHSTVQDNDAAVEQASPAFVGPTSPAASPNQPEAYHSSTFEVASPRHCTFPTQSWPGSQSTTDAVMLSPPTAALTCGASRQAARTVTDRTERSVFSFYINHAGPWHHFGQTVPRLALREPVLYAACLAYASHIMFLHGELDEVVHDEFQDRAIGMLIPLLSLQQHPRTRDGDAALLATAVILRMSEQFSELADDGQHHLRGSYSLFATIETEWPCTLLTIEGVAFWTHVRESIGISFLNEQACQFNLDMIKADLPTGGEPEEAWTNYMTCLLAQMCSACWGGGDGETRQSKTAQVCCELERWHAMLPDAFHPWHISREEFEPFSTVKFLSPWHEIAWQQYYTVKVMAGVYGYRDTRNESILEVHQFMQDDVIAPARMACSVCLSSDDTGSKINGSYLISWCGRFFTGKEEQRLLAKFLEEFMAKTKWPNRTCYERLRQLWNGGRKTWVDRDPKGLRRFPSPSFAGISQLWLVFHASTGQRFTKIDAVHRQLGQVVRIAPNHISFTAPRAYKDIYGHGSSILKDEFYSNVADGNASIGLSTDRDEHSRKRKALSRVFSAREITAMEPRVTAMIVKLCRALQIKSEGGQISDVDAYRVRADGAFDVRPWLNMFSYDAITAMFWSNTYGLLDKGNDLCPADTGSGSVKQVHAMDSFHSGSTFNIMYAQLPQPWFKLAKLLLKHTHNRQAAIDFAAMARHQVIQRLQSAPSTPDLFSGLPTEQTHKHAAMPLPELIAESATMLDAGNDTTQTALTNCLYHLARYPAKQRKLHAILQRSTSRAQKPVFSYAAQLQHVPYLRACLDESFRCRPPVASGLPRRTGAGGATIAGHFVPAGTTVSVPLYSVQRDEALFEDAGAFVPERWLREGDEAREGLVTSPEEARNIREFVLPFSLGGRACMGRNLAYMELSMVIAALVLGFEWELAEPRAKEMEMVERFNCNPKELYVRARVREGVDWA